jgi:hypothetical protein
MNIWFWLTLYIRSRTAASDAFKSVRLREPGHISVCTRYKTRDDVKHASRYIARRSHSAFSTCMLAVCFILRHTMLTRTPCQR